MGFNLGGLLGGIASVVTGINAFSSGKKADKAAQQQAQAAQQQADYIKSIVGKNQGMVDQYYQPLLDSLLRTSKGSISTGPTQDTYGLMAGAANNDPYGAAYQSARYGKYADQTAQSYKGATDAYLSTLEDAGISPSSSFATGDVGRIASNAASNLAGFRRDLTVQDLQEAYQRQQQAEATTYGRQQGEQQTAYNQSAGNLGILNNLNSADLGSLGGLTQLYQSNANNLQGRSDAYNAQLGQIVNDFATAGGFAGRSAPRGPNAGSGRQDTNQSGSTPMGLTIPPITNGYANRNSYTLPGYRLRPVKTGY